MENSVKKSKAGNIVASIILFVIGILAIVFPFIFKDVINIMIGVILLIIGFAFISLGLLSLYGRSLLIISGIFVIVGGILMFTNPEEMVKIVGIVLGVFTILSGIYKLALVPVIKSKGGKIWIWELIIGILYLVFGILLICYVNEMQVVLIYFLGAYLIILGISRFIDSFETEKVEYSEVIHFTTKENNKSEATNKEFQNNEEIVDVDYKEKDKE